MQLVEGDETVGQLYVEPVQVQVLQKKLADRALEHELSTMVIAEMEGESMGRHY